MFAKENLAHRKKSISPSALRRAAHAPGKRLKFSKASKVPRIARYHCNPGTTRTRGDERVVGQSCLSNAFVVVPGAQASQNFARLRPIAEVGNQETPDFSKVAL